MQHAFKNGRQTCKVCIICWELKLKTHHKPFPWVERGYWIILQNPELCWSQHFYFQCQYLKLLLLKFSLSTICDLSNMHITLRDTRLHIDISLSLKSFTTAFALLRTNAHSEGSLKTTHVCVCVWSWPVITLTHTHTITWLRHTGWKSAASNTQASGVWWWHLSHTSTSASFTLIKQTKNKQAHETTHKQKKHTNTGIY